MLRLAMRASVCLLCLLSCAAYTEGAALRDSLKHGSRRNMETRIDRRKLLRLMAASPVAGVLAACGGSTPKPSSAGSSGSQTSSVRAPIDTPPTPSPTATPEPPYVVPAGENQYALMAGTS